MPKLTKRTVTAIKAGEKEFFVWDSAIPGFGLRVKPTGVKSFFIQYRNRSHRTRKYVIGRVGVVPAEQARKTAARLLSKVAEGVDPSAERKDTRHAKTIADLADRYLEEYATEHKAPQSILTDRSNLENHIKPLIGTLAVRDLSRSDIEKMMRDIKNGKTAALAEKKKRPTKKRGRRTIKGGPVAANRCQRLISKMLNLAEQWKVREGNPARGMKLYDEKPSHRFLEAAEIERLVNALDEADRTQSESKYAIAAFRMLMLTGLRRNEVFNLLWKDVDLKKGVVRLQTTKAGQGRDVSLNTQAQAVLAGLDGSKPEHFVFQGVDGPDSRIAAGRPWERIRKAAGLEPIEINGKAEAVRLHTLRHTVGTHGAAAGLSEFQLMQQLGHKSAATTRRYVQEIEEGRRRDAEKIGTLISAMGSGRQAEFIDLGKKKAG